MNGWDGSEGSSTYILVFQRMWNSVPSTHADDNLQLSIPSDPGAPIPPFWSPWALNSCAQSIDTHAHITKNKNKTYTCETTSPGHMQLPPPHPRSLSKTTGGHHREPQLDTRRRPADHKEPGPNRYSYITAPPATAQGTSQKSQNTKKAAMKKSLPGMVTSRPEQWAG